MDNPEGIAYLQSKQLYEEGKTLKDDIGEELFAGLAEIFTQIGLDEESFRKNIEKKIKKKEIIEVDSGVLVKVKK